MSMEMKLNTVRVYFKIQDNTVVAGELLSSSFIK